MLTASALLMATVLAAVLVGRNLFAATPDGSPDSTRSAAGK